MPTAPAPAKNTPSRCRYRLLALDLDGTLFDSRGRISPRNVRAIQDARTAGMAVTVCTGRGLVECRHALEAIAQVDPVIVAGGALVACPVSSRTLHRFAVEQRLVSQTTDCLLRHRHPVLILKDPLEAGYDYLVVTGEEPLALDPVTRWWFESMSVRVRYVRRLDEDEHPEHTVRVGACGMSGALARIKAELVSCLGDQAMIHHFPAVVSEDLAPKSEDGQTLHVLEVFDKSATKWSAVAHLAGRLNITPDQIAAIGDEINDVPMLRGAGLGIAMGNAVPDARAAAKRHTLSNDDHGVAYAIDKILEGAW